MGDSLSSRPFAIQKRHPEMFLGKPAQPNFEVICRLLRALDECVLALLRHCSAAQFDRCYKLSDFRCSKPFDSAPRRKRRIHHRLHRPEPRHYLVAQLHRAFSPHPDTQQNRQQFPIGQILRPACQQPFARPFILRPLGDPRSLFLRRHNWLTKTVTG
jgi:hypothetical protein